MASTSPLKNKDGVIYGYQIKVYRGRDADGKQLKPYSTVWRIPEGMKNARTIKKELDKFAAIFEKECKEGQVALEKKTFADAAKYFITLKERDRKHRTVYRYKQLLERVNEEIGHLKLTDVTPEHLNRFYIKLGEDGQNKQTGGGLSTKTIREHHNLIHAVFAQALKEGLVRTNPAESATPPVNKKKEAEFFEVEDIQKIMSCLDKEPLKWRCITLLMIATGARRGEIMGLKWQNVDFKKCEIKIWNNLQYTPENGTYEDTPKTGASRYVIVEQSVMRLLAQHKKEQTLARFRLGELWNDTGYCFTQENGKPMHPNSITDYLLKFAKKYDLPHINPHKFRHTQASILYAAGIDPITISKRLGHQQVSTTQNIYAHMVAKADAEASSAVADVLFRKKA